MSKETQSGGLAAVALGLGCALREGKCNLRAPRRSPGKLPRPQRQFKRETGARGSGKEAQARASGAHFVAVLKAHRLPRPLDSSSYPRTPPFPLLIAGRARLD